MVRQAVAPGFHPGEQEDVTIANDLQRNLASAIEAQIAEYMKVADLRMYGLQQRAIAATNAKPTPANFVNAIVSDTIFPSAGGGASGGGAMKVTSTGVTKYGRRGEYVLHIGVDEEVSRIVPKHDQAYVF